MLSKANQVTFPSQSTQHCSNGYCTVQEHNLRPQWPHLAAENTPAILSNTEYLLIHKSGELYA